METKRLYLRPWRETDAEELYRYAKDPSVGPAAGWPVHTSVEDSLRVIRGALSAPETYALVLKETGKPVGIVGIARESAGSCEAEIGYWLGAAYWGRGLIPEAVEALLKRCFTELGCERVWCAYYEGNGKSRRVQGKCGFVYHHTEENQLCRLLNERRTVHYSCITLEEWKKRASG